MTLNKGNANFNRSHTCLAIDSLQPPQSLELKKITTGKFLPEAFKLFKLHEA